MMLTEDDVIQAYMDSDVDADWLVSEMVIFARAVIAANNAKALEGVEPLAGYHEIASYDGDVYAGHVVAPLIQRVKELEEQLTHLRLDIAEGLRL